MSFWASYVLLKEAQGVNRDITLGKLEVKYGLELRQQIETELAQEVVEDAVGEPS